MKSIKEFESNQLKFNLNSVYGGRKDPTHSQYSQPGICVDTFDEYNTRTGETKTTRVETTICA